MSILYLLLPLLCFATIPSFAQYSTFQSNNCSKYESLKRQQPKEDHRGGGRRDLSASSYLI